MNRIDTVFKTKKDPILSVYFTAGYPNLDDTNLIISELEKSGADMIEVGIPFSDSMVDGETIQKSNAKALENGMSLQLLFEQLSQIRQKTQIPLVMMGYLNQVIQFGIENFCQKCQEVGIDGIILPDIPLEIYHNEYKAIFDQYGLYYICLITPQTPDSRIRVLDEASQGFLYVVSSASTTGAKVDVGTNQEAYLDKVQKMGLKNPLLIGFGISDRHTFLKSSRYGQGAIIGSAFIKAISQNGDLATNIEQLVGQVVGK